ncbi:MAG: tetratricopeptide repeat protein [Byssovorax sp.]
MGTRDLLLLIGFLRNGKMFPTALAFKTLPVQRSLKPVLEGMAEQERALFGKAAGAGDREDRRRRAALTAWSGEALAVGTRIGEIPDPGVVLCLLYDVPANEAPLPVDIFAQTLRRYAIRDAQLRARFEQHVDESGTYVPAWLSPEVRRQKSQEAFEAAMKVAREHGFAHAAPLFEGVRGDSFAPAQVAIAVDELRELGDVERARRRLDEVIRTAPRNVAARMQRARVLVADTGRQVEAAADDLDVLREISRPDTQDASREVREVACEGLWALHREFANSAELDAAVQLSRQDPTRGFEALSRYVHTHPCSWDAQARLASLALSQQRFDLTVKLLSQVRWLFADDPNPHFVYGQALASLGKLEPARAALAYAAALGPQDHEIGRWLAFVQRKLASEQVVSTRAPSVSVADHVARSLLLLLGIVRDGRLHASATVLNKLPGDVALAFVLQSIAAQEQRRFGAEETPRSESDLRDVSERCLIKDLAGETLSVEQTVGDVPDPGILVVLLHASVGRDEAGRPVFELRHANWREALLGMVRQDLDMANKLDRHLKSADASIKARLDEA